jgi:hypothetical protein
VCLDPVDLPSTCRFRASYGEGYSANDGSSSSAAGCFDLIVFVAVEGMRGVLCLPPSEGEDSISSSSEKRRVVGSPGDTML